jgi:hypothetical protein
MLKGVDLIIHDDIYGVSSIRMRSDLNFWKGIETNLDIFIEFNSKNMSKEKVDCRIIPHCQKIANHLFLSKLGNGPKLIPIKKIATFYLMNAYLYMHLVHDQFNLGRVMNFLARFFGHYCDYMINKDIIDMLYYIEKEIFSLYTPEIYEEERIEMLKNLYRHQFTDRQSWCR